MNVKYVDKLKYKILSLILQHVPGLIYIVPQPESSLLYLLTLLESALTLNRGYREFWGKVLFYDN